MEGRCLQCGEQLKTIEHLFFNCPKAQVIWKLAPVSWEGLSQATDSFSGWWLAHGKARNREEILERQELTAFILWYMWKAKNALVFCGESWDEREIIERAWRDWRDWKDVQQKENHTVIRRVQEVR